MAATGPRRAMLAKCTRRPPGAGRYCTAHRGNETDRRTPRGKPPARAGVGGQRPLPHRTTERANRPTDVVAVVSEVPEVTVPSPHPHRVVLAFLVPVGLDVEGAGGDLLPHLPRLLDDPSNAYARFLYQSLRTYSIKNI